VSAETWEAARVVLERNQFWNVRNAKREYLLRGLLVCGQCGYHYTGSGGWYHCLARRRAARLWGRELAAARRCTDSLPLRAAKIEAEVWGYIERRARHPDEALAELAVRLHGTADASASLRAELAEKQQAQEALQQQRDDLHTYYLKGKMSERDLDRQKGRIAEEERTLAADLAALTGRLSRAEQVTARLSAAARLLEDIRGTLDGPEPLTPARKRGIVEQLVDEMTVQIETNPATGKCRAVVHVTYCFDDQDDRPAGAGAAGHIIVYDPAHTMVCNVPRRLVEK
jgi:site-specific DNA recombinase